MDIKEIIQPQERNSNNIKTIIKGSIVAILITIIGLLTISILLTYTSIKETIEIPAIIILTIISIIIRKYNKYKEIEQKRNNKWWISWTNIYISNLLIV